MTTNSQSVGFVYVLTNKAMPGLVKVGFTMSLAEDRSLSLYTSGVPEPFVIAFRSATSWPRKVEQHAHKLLAAQRHNKSREFFRISAEEAILAIREALLCDGGIANWDARSTCVIEGGDRLALSLRKGQVFALVGYTDMTQLLTKNSTIIDLWQAHSDGDLLEIMGSHSSEYVAGISDNDPGSTDDPVPFLDRKRTVPNGQINGRERLSIGERLVWLPPPDSSKDEQWVVFEASCPCQVVSRTWTPIAGEHGFSYLLNDFQHHDIWPAAKLAIQAALALPVPRSWASRSTHDNWTPAGTEPQPPEYWLPQLNRRPKSR